MPIQLPELRRVAPVAPAPVGRIRTGIPDRSRAIGQTAAGVVNLSKQILAQVDHVTKATHYTEKIKAGDEYENAFHLIMDGDSATNTPGLIHSKGNPTEDYNKFDITMEDKLQEIAGRFDGDLGDTVLAHLRHRQARLANKRMSAYGHQYLVYQDNVKALAIDVKKKGIVTSIDWTDRKRPDFSFMDADLAGIEELISKHAVAIGSSSEAEDGSIELDPVSKEQIKKHKSQAIFNTVDNLLSLKQTGEAKVVMDRYSDLLDDPNRIKLQRKMADKNLDNKALNELAKLRHLTLKDQEAHLAKIVDEPTRKKASQFLTLEINQKDQRGDKDSRDAYDEAMNIIRERTSQGVDSRPGFGRFSNIFEFTNESQGNEDLFERVTDSGQKTALREAINRPKGKSSIKTITRLDKEYDRSNFINLTIERFNEMAVGTNASDYNRYHNLWINARKESASGERGRLNSGRREIVRAAGEDFKAFTKRARGKGLTDKSLELQSNIIRRYDEWAEDNRDTRPSTDEAQRARDRIILQEIRKAKEPKGFIEKQLEAAGLATRRLLFENLGIGEKPSLFEGFEDLDEEWKNMSDDEVKVVFDEFRRLNPTVTPTDDRLKEFWIELQLRNR